MYRCFYCLFLCVEQDFVDSAKSGAVELPLQRRPIPMKPKEKTATTQSDRPLDALVHVIETRLSRTGDYETPIANLTLFRRDSIAPPAVCMVERCIVLVAQGVKHLWVGGEAYQYDTSRFLVTSLDLPANSEVVEAAPGSPCVGLTLKLDLRVLAELIAHSSLPPVRG